MAEGAVCGQCYWWGTSKCVDCGPAFYNYKAQGMGARYVDEVKVTPAPPAESLTIRAMQEEAYSNALAHGFHAERGSIGVVFDPKVTMTALMLAVTELAEAAEAVRHGNPPSEHVPEISALAEELADEVIRCGDMAGLLGIDLEQAVRLKMAYNRTRPMKHGKEL